MCAFCADALGLSGLRVGEVKNGETQRQLMDPTPSSLELGLFCLFMGICLTIHLGIKKRTLMIEIS